MPLTLLAFVPWLEIGLYVLYRWLNSHAGLGAVKTLLWAPVDQFCYTALTTAAYGQTLVLSGDSNHNPQSRGHIRFAEQARSAVDVVELCLFRVLPILLDLLVGVVYLWVLFDVYMAVLVGSIAILYLWASSTLSSKQDGKLQDVKDNARHELDVQIEALNSWRTVVVRFTSGLGHEPRLTKDPTWSAAYTGEPSSC